MKISMLSGVSKRGRLCYTRTEVDQIINYARLASLVDNDFLYDAREGVEFPVEEGPVEEVSQEVWYELPCALLEGPVVHEFR